MKTAYSASGVDLGRAYRILGVVSKKTGREISHFATLVSLPRSRERLAFSADGVGTKIELLARMGWDHISGWDCVAMNANDLLCRGAQPLWFLDYFSQNKLDPTVFARVFEGMKNACAAVGAQVIGGETAELPGMFASGTFYELAGFMVGLQEPLWKLSYTRVRKGDLLIGLESSGPHANGFSLIRKVVPPQELRKHATALLAPTRLYHPVLRALQKKPKLAAAVHSMAHITGGGFVEKLPRALPAHLQAVVDLKAWNRPEIFRYLVSRAAISETEAMGVWNMGIGLVMVVDPEGWPEISKIFGAQAHAIGLILPRPQGAAAVRFLSD